MCSAANYVLPLRRTCEVIATPNRVYGGVVMPTNVHGARPHGVAQDTEMDVAWQELMAISELQEFEVPAEGPYDTTPYQNMEPMVPMGGYGMVHSQSEHPPPACELSSRDTYNGCQSEDVPVSHLQCSNTGTAYGHYEYQHNQKMHPVSSQALPSVMALREQVNISGNSQGYRMASNCYSQGLSRHIQWTTHGQSSLVQSADDMESDSGLSLGSSPPLASPDNPASGVLSYQSVNAGIAFSDIESGSMAEHARRAHIHYSTNYQSQSQSFLLSGATQPNFSAQATLSHPHLDALSVQSTKQQLSQAAVLSDLFTDAGVTNRGSSQHDAYTKSQGSGFTPAPPSRDERRAISLQIPFPMDKIINLPVDDFNELLTQFTLTDNQLALVRDIRRRGKNKVAAQNCRKRKLESIIHLEQELNQLQVQRDHLAQERLEFQRSLAFIKCRLTDLYTEVFAQLRDEDGQPYSLEEYSLQQTPDGKIYLVPHTTTSKREQC